MRSRATKGRRYGGLGPEDRDAARRERLLDAAVEVFGTEGYATSAIEPLCVLAGVGTRAFYDHFETKEDLLIEVYDRIIRDVVDEVTRALGRNSSDLEQQVRAGVDAFVRATVHDLRKARIQLIEVVGVSERLERHRRETLHGFARMIERDAQRLHSAGAIARAPGKLVTMGLVGATIELMVDWVNASRRPPVERIIDALVTIYTATLNV